MTHGEHEEWSNHVEYQQKQLQLEYEQEEMQRRYEEEMQAQENIEKLAYRRHRLEVHKINITINDDDLIRLSNYDFEVILGIANPMPDESLYPSKEEDLPW
jgi:hypothetical protein